MLHGRVFVMSMSNLNERTFAVTAKLICVFVFAFAKSRFSHDAAHIRFLNTFIKKNVQLL